MDLLLVDIVELMHQAERDPANKTGHDKKKCVMHGIKSLLKLRTGCLTLLDAFVDVTCVIARSRVMLRGLARSCSLSSLLLQVINPF